MMHRFQSALILLSLSGIGLCQRYALPPPLSIPSDAGAVGRGKTGTAVIADPFTINRNPAGLAFLDNAGLGFERSKLLPGLTQGYPYYHLVAHTPLPSIGTLGGYALHVEFGDQQGMDEYGNVLASINSVLSAYGAGLGIRITDRSSVGFDVKVVHVRGFFFSSKWSRSPALDMRVGASYFRRGLISDRLDFGLVVNMGPVLGFGPELPERLNIVPQNMRAGFCWRAIRKQGFQVLLVHDLSKVLMAGHPNIDYDGDGKIGGYDKDRQIDTAGEHSRNGKWEYAHTDPWYLAVFTSWWDDWLYGGDRDLDGDLIIDPDEKGNRTDGSLQDELDDMVRYWGLECWIENQFVYRMGGFWNGEEQTLTMSYGLGFQSRHFGMDFGILREFHYPWIVSCFYRF